MKVKISETLHINMENTKLTAKEVRTIVNEEMKSAMNDLLLRINERIDEE